MTLLLGLDPDQARVVQQPLDKPCIISAGPGGGKTRTLCARILRLLNERICPYDIIAITFTRKAANEMKERLALSLGGLTMPLVRTFHSFALWILRAHTAELGFTRDFKVVTGKQQMQLIRDSVAIALGKQQDREPKSNSKNALGFAAMIRRAKSLGHTPAAYTGEQKLVFEKYEESLRFSCSMDMEDFVRIACELFESRPEVLAKYSQKYLLVDEIQDANRTQLQLCNILTKHSGRLTVVGDVNQSIYGFRGATPNLNISCLSTNANIVRLTRNYRSTEFIVRASEALIARNSGSNSQATHSQTHVYKPPAGPTIKTLVCETTASEIQAIAEIIQKVLNEGNRSIAVLCRTRFLVNEVQVELVRRKVDHYTSTSQKQEDELYGSPLGRTIVKFINSLLALAINSSDDAAFQEVNQIKKFVPNNLLAKLKKLMKSSNGSSMFEALKQIATDDIKPRTRKSVEALLSCIQDLQASLPSRMCLVVCDLVKRLKLNELEPIACSSTDDKLSDPEDTADFEDDTGDLDEENAFSPSGAIGALIAECNMFDLAFLKRTKSSAEFLEEFRLWLGTQQANFNQNKGKVRVQGVGIFTIHASKGLEWDTVFIPRFNEGVLPSSQSIQSLSHGSLPNDSEMPTPMSSASRLVEADNALAEERRLAYVALTRCCRQCFISCALLDVGLCRPLHPSRFLDDIPADCKENLSSQSNTLQLPVARDPQSSFLLPKPPAAPSFLTRDAISVSLTAQASPVTAHQLSKIQGSRDRQGLGSPSLALSKQQHTQIPQFQQNDAPQPSFQQHGQDTHLVQHRAFPHSTNQQQQQQQRQQQQQHQHQHQQQFFDDSRPSSPEFAPQSHQQPTTLHAQNQQHSSHSFQSPHHFFSSSHAPESPASKVAQRLSLKRKQFADEVPPPPFPDPPPVKRVQDVTATTSSFPGNHVVPKQQPVCLEDAKQSLNANIYVSAFYEISRCCPPPPPPVPQISHPQRAPKQEAQAHPQQKAKQAKRSPPKTAPQSSKAPQAPATTLQVESLQQRQPEEQQPQPKKSSVAPQLRLEIQSRLNFFKKS